MVTRGVLIHQSNIGSTLIKRKLTVSEIGLIWVVIWPINSPCVCAASAQLVGGEEQSLAA